MCRSIKRLNIKIFVTTDVEIQAAARQFVRKVSGIREPSQKNKIAFEKAIKEIAKVTNELLKEIKVDSKSVL